VASVEGEDGEADRGSRGGVTSRYMASRRPGTPQAASGPCGGASVAPSNGSPFSSSPLLLLLRCAVVWTGDETPRRLGLGARGGAVAAYL
jgi:hypothetical protein